MKKARMEGRREESMRDNESVNVKRQVTERPATAGVGNERRADVRGAQEGGSRAEGESTRIGPGHTKLSHAVKHLEEMHRHGEWKMEK